MPVIPIRDPLKKILEKHLKQTNLDVVKFGDLYSDVSNYIEGMASLNSYSRICHLIAEEHGWWDVERNPLEVMALIVSEIGEFIEAARKNDEKNMKEELADIFIRLADYVGKLKINFDYEVSKKIEYNKNREYKHGGKLY